MQAGSLLLPPPVDPMTANLDALTRLYDDYARALIVFFHRRVGDAELAIDLMSETFTIAIERRRQFRGDSDEQLEGWLWTIARSLLTEHERRNEVASRNERRVERERRALSDREIERIEDLAESAELREAVARRLDLLPHALREAVRLRVVEDLPYEEVSARLGISESGARSRVERALRQIRHLLNFELPEDEAEKDA